MTNPRRRLRPSRRLFALACLLIGFAAAPAQAADVCPMLLELLRSPPAGFMADRAEKIDAKFWASKPLLEHGTCRLWASETAEAHEIRCRINDREPPSAADAWYAGTAESVDHCLTARPDTWTRDARWMRDNGLNSRETTWVFNDHKVRFKVTLTNDRRRADGSAYNEFNVEYLKY